MPLVGVALSCANLSPMRRMVQRWLRVAPERRGPQTLVLLPKMIGLMVAVFVSVHFLPVTGIGVLSGFSVFLASIAIETVRFALAAPASEPGGGADADPKTCGFARKGRETRRESETDGSEESKNNAKPAPARRPGTSKIMGEHGTWFDYLYRFPWWQDLSHNLEASLGRSWEWMLFGPTHWTLTHVMVAALVLLFVTYGAARFRAGVSGGGQAALIPPRTFNVRHMFELLCDAILGMMSGVMGEKNARRFFPLIGSLALFILFSNAAALIPGLAPGTDTLKTNLALSLLVFVLTHFYGFREHGPGYVKHFLGPIWWLAPLILIIELISHLVRPASLALRLMGNMAADHKVIFAFFALVPAVVTVPFYFLGMLVVVVQTLVFCLLSMVYISMAISHDH